VDTATNQLITIDTTDGMGAAVGPLNATGVEGLATANSNTLYATDTTRDLLLTVATASGAGTAVGGAVHDVRGLAFDPNSTTLYGSDESSNQLITIDLTTGAATVVGPLGFTNVRGLAFDPTGAGTLYGIDVTNPARLIRIDPATGMGTEVGTLDPAGGTIFNGVLGLAFDPAGAGTLYGSDTSFFDQLLTIDTTTGAGTTVGARGSLPSRVEGLAFDATTNTLYGTDISSGQLVTIDPTDGDATAVGSTGNGMQGLAFR
jgi:DNA-binding beta-propeller fold protein YncE